MKKTFTAAAAGVTGLIVTLGITGTAFAWSPQGKIVKTVQDLTTNSAVSNATTAGDALTVAPGDTLRYTVVVSNIGEPKDDHHDDMAFTKMTDSLPAGVEIISNTSEQQISEDMGTIVPGASVTKQYDVKVTDQTDGDIISNKACYTGNSTVKDNPQAGCSTVIVKVHVPEQPVYACTLLRVTKNDARTVTITNFTQTAENGVVFKDVVINWGDKSAALTTVAATGQTHQYTSAGTYEITAAAHFTVNGKDLAVSSTNCAATVSFTAPKQPTPPPAQLPNTGAGNVIIPAALTTVAGYAAYAFARKRRAARQ